MAISAKGVKQNSYVSKSIQPGIVEARIIKLEVTKVEKPRDPKVPEYKVTLNLLTKKPSDDFEGWPVNQNDPDGKKYPGQFGIVSLSNWNIKNFQYKNKKTGETVKVTYEEQIVNFFQEIAEAFGQPKLLLGKVYQTGFNNWKEFIEQLKKDLNFKDNYLHWVIGGSKTKNASGKTVVYLQLPDRRLLDNKKRISLVKEDLAQYDEKTMLYINEKAFVQTQIDIADEDADDEFNAEDGDFGGTDAGTDDTELFDNIESFDESDVDFTPTEEDPDF